MRFFIVLAILFSVHTKSFAQKGINEGEIPFPVGSELPFPWDVFEGEWNSRGTDGFNYRFRILSISDTGTRRVWVEKVDSLGRIVSRGSATVGRNQRVLHARVKSYDDARQHLRLAAYNETSVEGCKNREIVMSLSDLDDDGKKINMTSYFMERLHNLRD